MMILELTGTGLVADDLYLLAHHDVTGRPYLQRRAIGLGLAGALLAELVMDGSVRVRAGRVFVVAGRSRCQDGLARQVFGLVLGEYDPRPVRDWLLFLALGSAQGVALRLERAGYLARPGPGWRAQRWVPVSSDCAFAPLIRVRAVLDPSRQEGETDVVVAGLAAACGLGSRILPYGPAQGRRQLDHAVGRLAPDLRDLIAQTQAAVDAALLSQRV